MRAVITGISVGSLIITLECGTLEILEGLWEDYNTGHMKAVAQKYLVTDDIMEEFGEVKLTLTILEDEYKAGREYFSQFSGKFKRVVHICFLLKIDRNKVANCRLIAGLPKGRRKYSCLITF